MVTEFINPESIPQPVGYTQVVITTAQRHIHISGQVAWDTEGNLVGAGDLEAQAVQVFENLKNALAAAEATFSNVIKLNFFIVDYKPEQLAIIREVRDRYLSGNHPPASTLLGVQSLARAELLIEVEAIAVTE